MTKLITTGIPETIIADEAFSAGDLVIISGVDSEEIGEVGDTKFVITAIHVSKFEGEHAMPWGIIRKDVIEGEEIQELYLCMRWTDRV